MKTTVILCILFIPVALHAQGNAGIIYPGKSFLNKTNDTLFCLPKQKLETLIAREEINKELILTFENRVGVCDSALKLKGKEAENWYMKLIETGDRLKEAEIRNARQNQRNKVKSRVFFGIGVVLGWAVGALL